MNSYEIWERVILSVVLKLPPVAEQQYLRVCRKCKFLPYPIFKKKKTAVRPRNTFLTSLLGDLDVH